METWFDWLFPDAQDEHAGSSARMLRYSLLTGATLAGGPGKGPRSGLSGQESRRFGAAPRQSIRLPFELAGSKPDPHGGMRSPASAFRHGLPLLLELTSVWDTKSLRWLAWAQRSRIPASARHSAEA